MKAIANAGPLIALGKLGLIQLLHQLYKPVLVPSTVYDEVVTRGLESGQPDAFAVQLAIARRELNVVAVNTGTEGAFDIGEDSPLHIGERHVIALAIQQSPSLALLDDQLAREYAQRRGLQVKGTLGVIIEAHRRGLMTAEEVELVFQAILDRDDIWIAEALVHRVLLDWRREARRKS